MTNFNEKISITIFCIGLNISYIFWHIYFHNTVRLATLKFGGKKISNEMLYFARPFLQYFFKS